MITALGLLLFTASSVSLPDLTGCAIQRGAGSGDNLWLLCERERLLLSRDKGATWSSTRLPDDTKMRAIHFLNAAHGFVAGDGGTLLETKDAGKTCRKVDVPSTDNLTSIHFVGNRGWITGWSGIVLHSSDGGQVWRKQETGVNQSFESIFFADEKNGWAVGWAGAMIRTTDGGETWQKVRTVVLSSLNSVYFRDPLNGWAVGFDGQILRTRDGGQRWDAQVAPVRESLKSIVFDTAGRAWIAADSHLLSSDDAGETWKMVQLSGATALVSLIPTGDEVLVVGQTALYRHKAPVGGQQDAERIRSTS